jgi:hypothetical protein
MAGRGRQRGEHVPDARVHGAERRGLRGAIAFALVMGLAGGFLPAVRAARLEIVDALRAS